jgi:SAM-dependent methyltransferase
MDLTEVPAGTFRRHPWETARAHFFRQVLAQAGLLAGPRAVLDAGAGDGFVARTLLDALPGGSAVVCLDAHYAEEDLRRYAAPPRPELSFVRECPAQRFDLILLLDVLEHVRDDLTFLSSLVANHLGPGGTVLVSVPAWPVLFSRHDEALAHFRRYSPNQCRALLTAAGLDLREQGGLFHSLVVPRALAVGRERWLARRGQSPPAPPRAGDWGGGPALTTILNALLRADGALSRRLAGAGIALPGLSFWALAGAAQPDQAGTLRGFPGPPATTPLGEAQLRPRKAGAPSP